jgi:ABC-type multidrug transport system permease subunit
MILASSRTGLVTLYCIKLYTEFPAVFFAVHEACFRFFKTLSAGLMQMKTPFIAVSKCSPSGASAAEN